MQNKREKWFGKKIEKERGRKKSSERDAARYRAYKFVDMGRERLEVRLLLRERELCAESEEALVASRESKRRIIALWKC